MPVLLNAAAVSLFKSKPARRKWITAVHDKLQINGEYVNHFRNYVALLYKDQGVVFIGFACYSWLTFKGWRDFCFHSC